MGLSVMGRIMCSSSSSSTMGLIYNVRGSGMDKKAKSGYEVPN